MIAEGGVMLALALILDRIVLYQSFNGGSVTLAAMLPLVLFSVRWGIKRGVFLGAVFGIISLMLSSYLYHPLQAFIDYPLAFAFIGLSGIKLKLVQKDSPVNFIPSIIIAHLLRFFSHVATGVIYFASYAPEGQSPFIYSILYNGAYMLPETIILLIIFSGLYKPLNSIIKKQV